MPGCESLSRYPDCPSSTHQLSSDALEQQRSSLSDKRMPRHSVTDIIAREQLVLIKPAADTATLESTAQTPSEHLIGMGIADEARVKARLFLGVWAGLDIRITQTAATEKCSRQ